MARWLSPRSAVTQGLFLSEVIVKKETFITILRKKTRWSNLTYTGRSGKYWKWLQRKVSDVTYEASYVRRACWKKEVDCHWLMFSAWEWLIMLCFLSQLSLIVKVIPSPDWFVGVDSLNLCEGGQWKQEVTFDLHPFDAGTDSGFTFSSPNFPTTPPENITMVRYTSHDSKNTLPLKSLGSVILI